LNFLSVTHACLPSQSYSAYLCELYHINSQMFNVLIASTIFKQVFVEVGAISMKFMHGASKYKWFQIKYCNLKRVMVDCQTSVQFLMIRKQELITAVDK
jgi:hypothetical protein